MIEIDEQELFERELRAIMSVALDAPEERRKHESRLGLRQNLDDAVEQLRAVERQTDLFYNYIQLKKRIALHQRERQETAQKLQMMDRQCKRLDLYDYVSSQVTVFHEINVMTEKLNDVNQQEEVLQRQIQQIQGSLESMFKRYNDCQKEVDVKRKKLKDSQSDLNQAYLEQGQLTILKKELQRRETHLRQLHATVAEHEANLRQSVQQRDFLLHALDQLRSQMQQYDAHELMLREYGQIKDKLSAFKHEGVENEKLRKEQKEGTEECQRYDLQRKSISQQIDALSQECRTLQDQLRACTEKIGDTSMADMVKRRESFIQRRALLECAQDCWQRLSADYLFVNNTEDELNKRQNELRVFHNQLAENEDVDSRNAFNRSMGEYTMLERLLNEGQRRLKQNTLEWDRYTDLDPSFAECSPNINARTRAMQIERLIESAGKDIVTVSQEKTQFEALLRQQKTLTEALALAQKRLAEQEQKEFDVQANLRVLQVERSAIETLLSDSEKTISTLYADLQSVMSLPNWYEEWQQNPDSVRNRLNDFYMEWQTRRKQLEEAEARYDELKKDIEQRTKSLSDFKLQYDHDQEAYEAFIQQRDQLEFHLTRCFNGQTPQEYQTLSQQNLEMLEEQLKGAKERYDDMDRQSLEMINYQAFIHDEQRRLRDQLQVLNMSFDMWIENHNDAEHFLQRSGVEDLLSDNTDWTRLRKEVEELRRKLDVCDMELDHEQSQFVEIRSKLDFADIDEESAQEIFELRKKSLKQQVQRLTEDLIHVEAELHAHHKACERAEAFKSQGKTQ